MKRFLPVLIVLLALLASIPACILSGWIVLAKIIGIVVVITTTISIRIWVFGSGNSKSRPDRIRFTINDRYFLKERVPLYNELSSGDRYLLDERAGLILSELWFDHYDHRDPDKEECLGFAFLLALLTKEKAYTSLKGKTVVFRSGNPAEYIFQSGAPLLFIAIEDVLKELSGSGRTNEGAAMRAVLDRFYAA